MDDDKNVIGESDEENAKESKFKSQNKK